MREFIASISELGSAWLYLRVSQSLLPNLSQRVKKMPLTTFTYFISGKLFGHHAQWRLLENAVLAGESPISDEKSQCTDMNDFNQELVKRSIRASILEDDRTCKSIRDFNYQSCARHLMPQRTGQTTVRFLGIVSIRLQRFKVIDRKRIAHF